MEDEIDLRQYINIIARRWKWVLGITLLALLVATIVSYRTVAPTYEATATILALRDPWTAWSGESFEAWEAHASVLWEMLTSTEVEAKVVEVLQEMLTVSEAVPGSLRGRVKVEQHGWSGIFGISARAGDPQLAAEMANAWAEAGVEVLRQAQAPPTEELSIAEQSLAAAEQAVWEFAEANGLAAADVWAYSRVPTGVGSINLYVHQGGEIGQAAQPILPTEKRAELNDLLRARTVAEDTYLSLARQTAAVQVEHEAGTGVRLLSSAPVPTAPTESRKELNIAIAGALGLMLGVCTAFAAEFLEGRRVGLNSG